MTDRPTILDKQGQPIDIHHRPVNWKLSPFERDCIYQEFLRAFPTSNERRGILRECLAEDVRARAIAFFEAQASRWPISANRIHAFVSEAVATEAGYLPKSERWDWWVGCSFLESNSASSAVNFDYDN